MEGKSATQIIVDDPHVQKGWAVEITHPGEPPELLLHTIRYLRTGAEVELNRVRKQPNRRAAEARVIPVTVAPAYDVEHPPKD